MYELASIGDYVFEDMNANGVQDSEDHGISGVHVSLVDANNNVIDTAITDNNGKYSFDNIVPGDYHLVFTTPNGYVITPANAGTDDDKDSDVENANGETAVTSLIAGEDDKS